MRFFKIRTEGMVTILLSELQTEHKVVGAKQSRKAVQRGIASCVFLADDADPQITDSIRVLCAQAGVPVYAVPRMKQLGESCGIHLGCAVAAVLNP